MNPGHRCGPGHLPRRPRFDERLGGNCFADDGAHGRQGESSVAVIDMAAESIGGVGGKCVPPPAAVSPIIREG